MQCNAKPTLSLKTHILVLHIRGVKLLLVQEVAGLSPGSLRLLATPVSVSLTEVSRLKDRTPAHSSGTIDKQKRKRG